MPIGAIQGPGEPERHFPAVWRVAIGHARSLSTTDPESVRTISAKQGRRGPSARGCSPPRSMPGIAAIWWPCAGAPLHRYGLTARRLLARPADRSMRSACVRDGGECTIQIGQRLFFQVQANRCVRQRSAVQALPRFPRHRPGRTPVCRQTLQTAARCSGSPHDPGHRADRADNRAPPERHRVRPVGAENEAAVTGSPPACRPPAG